MTRLVSVIIGIASAAALLLIVWPPPRALIHPTPSQATRILDRSGRLLYEVKQGNDGGQTVTSEQIPQHIVDAVIATEDRNFRLHPGISLRAIARAAFQNITAGRVISGGSTITQQLVRIRLQPKKRDFLWKIREAFYALKLERRLTKEEILTAYLNEAYFGHQAYGMAAASSVFFAKPVSALSIPESALLIGLLQSPSAYDPFRSFAAAKKRQRSVLATMREEGILSEEEENDAGEEPIVLSHGKEQISAPHFVMWLREHAPEAFDGRPSVRTTLDLPLQQEVERIVGYSLEELKTKNVTSAAVVVLNAHTGELLAMLGSGDYFDTEHDGTVNVATSPRQPGSALKPFTYALALESGATPATTVADVETQFFTQEGNPYIPRNYDYGYHGLVRYREALANSYNIAAVRVLETVGVNRLLSLLRSAGISTLTQNPEHYGLALTLGSGEVTLLELTRAYAVFARQGVTLPLQVLADQKTEPGKRLLGEKTAWLIADILSDPQARIPEFGQDGPLNFDFPVAAKTGTTRNSRDNWTIGFTPDRIVGVWVGNADNSPMKGTTGVTGAGPIFHDVMLAATRGLPRNPFERPPGVVEKTICRLSGKLPTPACPHTMEEVFAAGTEPTETDDLFQAIDIDPRTQLRASADCPERFRIPHVFGVFPPELKTWSRENGWKEPPRDYSPLCAKTDQKGESWLTILSPQLNDTFLLDPLIPDTQERVIFTAQASDDIKTVEWRVNGKRVGEGTAPSFRFPWIPVAGRWTIEAIAGNLLEQRKISVEKR